MSRLGELLLKRSLITQDQLTSATTDQQQQGGILASRLVRLGVVNEDQLVRDSDLIQDVGQLVVQRHDVLLLVAKRNDDGDLRIEHESIA